MAKEARKHKRLGRDVAIVGVGLHPWGKFPDKSFRDLGVVAVNKALEDAHMKPGNIQTVGAGIAAWDGFPGVTSGFQVAQELGMLGIPIINVYTLCATSHAALDYARRAVATGQYDIALAVGMDMSPGGFFVNPGYNVKGNREYIRFRLYGAPNTVYWAANLRRRMNDVGTTEEVLAKIKVKASKCGALNPNARYKKVFTVEEVLASPIVSDPLRLLEICAVSDGAAAVVITSLDMAHKFTDKPILIEGVGVTTSSFNDPSARIAELSHPVTKTKGPLVSEAVNAADMVYEESGLKPQDIDFVELPDNSSWHELVYSEAILKLKEGEADGMLLRGETEVGGKIPINPSGGIASFGEAVGAQGMAMIYEVCTQLRGEAGKRQVPNAKVGWAQTYGSLGHSYSGACALSRAF